MAELFSKHHWFGEFFLPSLFEKRFPGEISYSPEEGVTLSYRITGYEVPPQSEVIFGILSTGEKCTLLGRFSPTEAGIAFHNGITTRPGKAGFLLLAVGDFLAPDEKFSDVNFSLTNLQEFFYPSGSKDQIKFSKDPIYSVTTPFGRIEVGNTATFDFVPSDITSYFYSHEPEALSDLGKAYNEIRAKFPRASFMLKKDIAYRILLKLSPAITLLEAYQHITSVSELFALLIYNPVYPESIQVKKRGINEQTISINIFPSMAIESRTVEICTQKHSHWNLPLTQSAIPFDSVVSTWLEMPQHYSPIISSIQHETGFKNEHSLHGEIVLYATQLESISHAANNKHIKYEYPIGEYGNTKIHNNLMKILGKSTLQEVGTAIGDLRNEIAHVGKPQKWLATLSLDELVLVSQYLQLTIIGYILKNAGIPADAIEKYQDAFVFDT